MHVCELPPRTPEKAIFGSDVADLIENVGGSAFPQRLFQVVHNGLGCIHMNAFATSGRQRTMVLAENVGSSDIAREIGSKYMERYWELDPVNRPGLHESATGSRVVEIGRGDIDDTEYRRQCYMSVRIGARISICENRQSGTMRLNFYREHAFSLSQKEAIIASAGLLMPLLWRHALDRRPPLTTHEDFEERLAEVAPDLPGRERQVCALIALGVTSEGIGLRLDISLNTVLTYRKRAYTRLAITSQNQLLRLMYLQPENAHQPN